MSDKIKIDLIFQVSICVNDMEAVMKNFRELFDIDEATLIKRCTKDFYDRGEFDGARYLGKHCEFYIKYYRFDLGGIDFEIIEPLDKNLGNPYSDFLIQNGGKNGIHHIACKIHDRTVFIQKMEQMGIPPLTCGTMGAPMPNGEKKDFYFYDLRDLLGIIIEAGNIVVGPLANHPLAGNPEGYVGN